MNGAYSQVSVYRIALQVLLKSSESPIETELYVLNNVFVLIALIQKPKCTPVATEVSGTALPGREALHKVILGQDDPLQIKGAYCSQNEHFQTSIEEEKS